MALLPNHPPNLAPEVLSQHHLSQSGTRTRRFQQVRQLAARAPDRDWLPGPQLALGSIDQGSQLLGKPPMSTPCLVGSHLHGDGEEPVVIAIHVRLQ